MAQMNYENIKLTYYTYLKKKLGHVDMIGRSKIIGRYISKKLLIY